MRTVVITGANRGIGLELVKKYRLNGDQVVAVCRKSTPELDEIPVKIIENIDVSYKNSVERLAKELESFSIEILINNAGIFLLEELGQINYNAVVKQFEVNAVSPIRVSEALLKQMGKGSKIAMITSRMGSIEDNSSGSYYGYRMSKAALNAATKSLSVDLKEREIATGVVHPGFVKTNMTDGRGDITPEVAAANIFDRIENLNMGNSGTFWHAAGDKLPW